MDAILLDGETTSMAFFECIVRPDDGKQSKYLVLFVCGDHFHIGVAAADGEVLAKSSLKVKRYGAEIIRENRSN